jgi:hypothetical protein
MAALTDGFERRGEFWYRPGRKGHNPYEPRVCEGCGEVRMIKRNGRFCSADCAPHAGSPRPGQRPPHPGLGAEHHSWIGDRAGYIARHQRVYRSRGKATSCVWGCPATLYHWANLTGDVLDPDDYASMCPRCHARFDAAVKMTATSDRRYWRAWRNAKVRGTAAR